MSKIFKVILMLVVFILLFSSCEKKSENILTVYAYDSFADTWGPGKELVDEFEKLTGIKVNLVGCGGAVEMYSKLLFEGKDTPADIILGLSDNMDIDNSKFDSLREFDYGYYCFLYNENEINEIPKSFENLIDSKFKGKYILIDPRTSSVGLGLLKWTVLAMGENAAMEWWKTAINNALTVCDSWSSAYGLFTENEAPLVISYTTSPAYHIINEDNYAIKAIEFKEGHIKTDEFIGILKDSNMKKEAEQFCSFILNQGQNRIAVSNTMFPANPDTDIPKALSECLKPEKILDSSQFTGSQEELINRWISSAFD